MKLHKATQLALIAVLELARNPDITISTKCIADNYGISSHHLAKVMRNLVQQRLVHAIPGTNGGYRFAGNVKTTTLLDIIQLFEKIDFDIATLHVSNFTDDPIKSELQSIGDEICGITKSVLDAVTLATAIKNTRQRAESGKKRLSECEKIILQK